MPNGEGALGQHFLVVLADQHVEIVSSHAKCLCLCTTIGGGGDDFENVPIQHGVHGGYVNSSIMDEDQDLYKVGGQFVIQLDFTRLARGF